MDWLPATGNLDAPWCALYLLRTVAWTRQPSRLCGQPDGQAGQLPIAAGGGPHFQHDNSPQTFPILVDDMGFADHGAMGSEIRTPRIDDIARQETAGLSSMYPFQRR